jgi:hypothetical protein
MSSATSRRRFQAILEAGLARPAKRDDFVYLPMELIRRIETARRAPAQVLEPAGTVQPQALDLLARGAPAHRHDQAAIGQRVGEAADERHCLGRPGREPARLVVVADRAHDVGGIAGVTAVEDAAQLLLVAQEGVRLVDRGGAVEATGGSQRGSRVRQGKAIPYGVYDLHRALAEWWGHTLPASKAASGGCESRSAPLGPSQ